MRSIPRGRNNNDATGKLCSATEDAYIFSVEAQVSDWRVTEVPEVGNIAIERLLWTRVHSVVFTTTVHPGKDSW